MARLKVLDQTEIMVPEEMKGKQIAVKESNLESLKSFFRGNKQPLQAEIVESAPVIEKPLVKTPMIELENAQAEKQVIIPVVEPETTETPVFDFSSFLNTESSEEPNYETPLINIIPDSNEDEPTEEMDPELKEIKDRLDQVIADLDNYKKK